jgi:hypothetical protein
MLKMNSRSCSSIELYSYHPENNQAEYAESLNKARLFRRIFTYIWYHIFIFLLLITQYSLMINFLLLNLFLSILFTFI